MCSGAHFSFPICVYVPLGHTGNPLLVYIVESWEKTKRQHFFLKPFHIFQSLIRTPKNYFSKIFKRSVASKELSFTQFEFLFKNLIEGTKTILESFPQFCNNFGKYFHSTLYLEENNSRIKIKASTNNSPD